MPVVGLYSGVQQLALWQLPGEGDGQGIRCAALALALCALTNLQVPSALLLVRRDVRLLTLQACRSAFRHIFGPPVSR